MASNSGSASNSNSNSNSNDHSVSRAVGRGRRSGTTKVGLGRRHEGEVGIDQIEYVQDDSDGGRVSSSSKNGNKKFVGERAMLAEAQKKYPTLMNETKRSERIQAKKRKNYNYSESRNRINALNYENCDCLVPECTGCHMPCRRCGDRRCGLDCRRGRRYIYSSVEIDGSNTEHFNPHHEDYQNMNPGSSDMAS